MKIPESVRIGGVEYEVIAGVPSLNDGQNMLYGQIDYHNSTIKLSDVAQGHQMNCITLWHEILHGIRNHAGLEIENEEEIIDMFARGIYQVLQDNGARFFDLKEGTEGCEYCRGCSYTDDPFTVITQTGQKRTVKFQHCPNCGRDLKGGDNSND